MAHIWITKTFIAFFFTTDKGMLTARKNGPPTKETVMILHAADGKEMVILPAIHLDIHYI